MVFGGSITACFISINFLFATMIMYHSIDSDAISSVMQCGWLRQDEDHNCDVVTAQ